MKLIEARGFEKVEIEDYELYTKKSTEDNDVVLRIWLHKEKKLVIFDAINEIKTEQKEWFAVLPETYLAVMNRLIELGWFDYLKTKQERGEQ